MLFSIKNHYKTRKRAYFQESKNLNNRFGYNLLPQSAINRKNWSTFSLTNYN